MRPCCPWPAPRALAPLPLARPPPRARPRRAVSHPLSRRQASIKERARCAWRRHKFHWTTPSPAKTPPAGEARAPAAPGCLGHDVCGALLLLPLLGLASGAFSSFKRAARPRRGQPGFCAAWSCRVVLAGQPAAFQFGRARRRRSSSLGGRAAFRRSARRVKPRRSSSRRAEGRSKWEKTASWARVRAHPVGPPLHAFARARRRPRPRRTTQALQAALAFGRAPRLPFLRRRRRMC
ncbi:MAG: hypothetical protein J3K34DRAFT_437674 [Monoraphidium minutum]|nr:MAG: hypothetical protein J3K34DRAFT_437674 [Monoraphidium minutum]